MENIVTITLLTLTLFGKIEMTTFEIPNTRENYNGMDGISKKDSNLLVCSNCGQDLEQKVNGVIKYIQADKNSELTLRVDIADDGQTS